MKVELACSLKARLEGLLLKERFEDALLLAPCNDIHTFGMKRPIDVAFLDRRGVVVRVAHSVGPGQRLFCRKAVATLERFSDGAEHWPSVGECLHFGLAADEEPTDHS